MTWLDNLLSFCLFCPPKEDSTERSTPKQLGLFANMVDREWHELLIELNSRVTSPDHPKSKQPTQFRETRKIRTYHLIPPEITWPDQPTKNSTRRLMQRDEIVENGIQVILYAHQVIFHNKKDEEGLRQLLVAIIKSHPVNEEKITDFCLYAWQHVIHFILKYQHDTQKINLEKIKEFYLVDHTKNTVNEKINGLKYMLAPELTEHEISTSLQKIAFDSELNCSIIDQLTYLKEQLTQLEQHNHCPFIIAATAYQHSLRIYPFEKNGCDTAKALINYILTQYGYQPIHIIAVNEHPSNEVWTSPLHHQYQIEILYEIAYGFECACREDTPEELAKYLKTMYLFQNTNCDQYKQILAENIACAAFATKLHLKMKSNKTHFSAFLSNLHPFTEQVINLQYENNQTLLHTACLLADSRNDPYAVKQLLNAGANPNLVDNMKRVPLSYLKNPQHREQILTMHPEYEKHQRTETSPISRIC